jgi:cephalosporin hydroxylase
MIQHEKLDRWYQELVRTPSDIKEHLELLRNLAVTHENVVEFGVRYGTSTIALLAGAPRRLTSYDIRCQINITQFQSVVNPRTTFQFFEADTLEADIPECDFLFIDTLHTASQVSAELFRHAPQVAKTIALHDTVTFGQVGEDGGPGLLIGIECFLADNVGWKIFKHYENNNGLMLLRRT